MAEWLSEEEQRAWRGLLRMHTNVMTALAQRLKTDSDMSLADYEVLANLSETPGGVLRARDLRCRLQWEKSRLAHHMKRMEDRGLVRRYACPEDGRAPLVALTEEGLALIREAAPAHVARVRELFLDALSPELVAALGEAADAVNENVARLECEPGDEREVVDLRS